MSVIKLKFSPENAARSKKGKKYCTTRDEPKGKAGDCFEIDGVWFRLIGVLNLSVSTIAMDLYWRFHTLKEELPLSGWYGTTVDGPGALDRIDAIRGLDRTTFVSFEPLTEPVEDLNLNGIDWVIAGGRSAANGMMAVMPAEDWIQTIVDAARDAGAAVFVKDNAGGLGGNWPREIPQAVTV